MRTTRISAALAVLALVVAACQPTGASPSPTSTGGGATSTPAPAAVTSTPAPAAVTLTVWEHQKPRIEVLQKIAPLFEQAMAAQGKNIKVEIVGIEVENDGEFMKKITIEYQGDSPPDVTSYGGNAVPDMYTAGYLTDLTDRLAGWADWEANFYPILRERAVQADGKIYSVPRGASVIEYFVRKDVLEANGISVEQPKSWQELIDRLKALRAKTNLPTVTIPAGKTWGGGTFDEGFIHLFLGTGGKLYNDATGKWIVKSQALTDVFNFYATLQENGLLPTEALLDPNPWAPTKYDGFTGTTADGTVIPVSPPITTQGSWGWIFDWGPAPTGARPIPDIFNKVITWAFPAQDGSGTYVWAAENWMWSISAKSKHPDEAFEFLKFVNSGEALAMDVAAVGNLAPRDDIGDVAPYKDMPYLIAMEELLPTGKSFKAGPGIDKIQQAVGEATEQILLGKMNGDEAAAFFTTQATDLLGPDLVEEGP